MERFKWFRRHSLCNGSPLSLSETGDIYIWGWNESGQLALPSRSLAEDRKTVTGEGEFLSFLTPGHMLA